MDKDFAPVPPGRFRLHKAATRVATVKGVPTVPLVITAAAIFVAAVQLSLWAFLAAIPAWVILAGITKTDDKAFRQWGLWLRTLAWPMLRNWRSYRLWGAVAWSPTDYRPRNRARGSDVLAFVVPVIVAAWLFDAYWLLAAVPFAWWAAIAYRRRTA